MLLASNLNVVFLVAAGFSVPARDDQRSAERKS